MSLNERYEACQLPVLLEDGAFTPERLEVIFAAYETCADSGRPTHSALKVTAARLLEIFTRKEQAKKCGVNFH